MTSRRRFISAVTSMAGLSAVGRTASAQTRPTIDVKKVGAFGNGKLPDAKQIREAISQAAEQPRGAVIYFPPGEYYLGSVEDAYLLMAKNLRNVRFVGERATISCRSVSGAPSMLVLAGCRNVAVEGLAFRDHGLDRKNRMGAAGIRLVDDDTIGCESIEIKDCTFESVLSGVVCRTFDKARQARNRGITLTNLSVSHSYYGYNFQDSGDDVVGRGLRCDDVNRSYFPYGVTNHDIELDTRNNVTGFTDVLIKTYERDFTSGLRVKVRCRGKRSGDAIVALDNQHNAGRGTIRDIVLDLDIDDVDCRLNTAILMRSFDPQERHETQTQNRWDNITIDGDVRICDATKLIEVTTTGKVPGRLILGPRISRNPRLPRSIPGFVVNRLQ